MEKYRFYVSGMHCASCETLIESELKKVSGVSFVKTTLKRRVIDMVGDFGDLNHAQVAEHLNSVLKPYGYRLSFNSQKTTVKWIDFQLALPLTISFVLFFIYLQKLGIVNLISSSKVGYGTAFLVGSVASVSTCMAVVGGLVLSMSASFAKEGDKIRPQIFFHFGRLASFFFFGGIIGLLGSVFQLNPSVTLLLSFLVALVLLIMGLNLLDVFPWVKSIQPALPGFIVKHIDALKKINHTLIPLLVGVATFFLPCGFTQSMQLYTLTTKSFLTGSLTMFMFSLGTLPALLLLSFGSLGINKQEWSGVFFKTAGLIVIFFGLYNLINVLVGVNIIPPIYNF